MFKYKLIEIIYNLNTSFKNIFGGRKKLTLTQIDDDIYLISMYTVNCFIIRTNDNKLILIDSLYPGYTKKLIKIIDKLEGELTDHIITHAHIDHVGNSLKLYKKYNFNIYISNLENDILQNNLNNQESLIDVFNTNIGEINNHITTKVKTPKNTLDIKDLNVKKDIKIVQLPGHTSGQIGLLVNNSLLCADALRNYHGTLKPVLVYHDIKIAKDTINKLSKLDFNTLLPSHGESYQSETLKQDILNINWENE